MTKQSMMYITMQWWYCIFTKPAIHYKCELQKGHVITPTRSSSHAAMKMTSGSGSASVEFQVCRKWQPIALNPELWRCLLHLVPLQVLVLTTCFATYVYKSTPCNCRGSVHVQTESVKLIMGPTPIHRAHPFCLTSDHWGQLSHITSDTKPPMVTYL